MKKQWALVWILSGLSMLGAFSIDAYLPSFNDIGKSLHVDREHVQQTLSVYLFTFAFMMLFYGTLSDTFGRRRVILWAVGGYVAGSVGAMCAPSFYWLLGFRALQGLSAGAGSVVGYHDGVSLMAVLESDAEVAESLFEALVFGRAEGAPVWRCGIVDAAEVGTEMTALRRAAEEAIEIARQDRGAPVRRWRRDEAGLAPDVVLIEDDAALSDMVQYVLRSAGLSFRAYSNGETALEALLAFAPDGRHPLVLLDVDLPGLDGHAVHDRLRAERPGTYAVVFISGHSGEGDEIRALRAGALDYVAKPVSLRTLAGKIPLWRERAAAR